MRERGLKLGLVGKVLPKEVSLPVRERGLKLPGRHSLRTKPRVAPRAGAWIEALRRSRPP
ncbi:hypothetical protein KM92DES2_10119 [uncultured Desulfovibrio sp.]|uniref:Uncharacterized protein n=1 Tax=uncultured Desulfovibrio sp. TaxID=167968 RepID=A0A212IVU7_9BACT|nr:hypothetical protein KM92DES2_10119 [uncultured Desulfovibrio sp.]